MDSCSHKRRTDSPIQALSDELLSRIFLCLPLKDRYLLCLVCKRWLNVSRIPWTDVHHLSLNGIPDRTIYPLFELCPSVQEIFANDQALCLVHLAAMPACSHLKLLKLYNVRFLFDPTGSMQLEADRWLELLVLFFRKFPNLEELSGFQNGAITYDPQFVAPFRFHRCEPVVQLPAFTMPSSLRRVQLLNGFRDGFFFATIPTKYLLQQLPNLESLSIQGSVCPVNSVMPGSHVWPVPPPASPEHWWGGLANMRNLRELAIMPTTYPDAFGRGYFRCLDCISLDSVAHLACEYLLQLEVLVFGSFHSVEPEGLGRLITSHATLRILLVAGTHAELAFEDDFVPVRLPQRVLRPNGRLSKPLPFLQVFVGGGITNLVRFALPQREAINYRLIDRPVPIFLATNPDVAEIFRGSWVFKSILDAIDNGADPWHEDTHGEACYHSLAPLVYYDSRQAY